MRSLGLACIAVGSTLTVSALPARACAPAPPAGESVSIAAEEALIVWDAASRTEHFIRRADFRTSAADFGFLVPTPSQPTLHEASDDVFGALSRAITPEPVVSSSFMPLTCCTAPLMYFTLGAEDDTMAPTVEVLATQRVAGMDASVLRADDASALAEWLADHGYPMRPALVEWLRPYVDAGFVVTAFRYVNDGTDRVGSAAVRMTFETEQPFYPYREPSDMPKTSRRSLRLYVVAASRVAANAGPAAWAAEVEHARPLPDATRVLAGAIPPEATAARAWLTTFYDRATERVPHDLTLRPSEATSEVALRASVVTREVVVPVPIEPVVVLAGTVYFWRRRKRRTAS